MKRLLTILAVFIALPVFAQGLSQPVSWSVSATDLGDGLSEIVARGTVSGYGWHITDLRDYPGGPNSTVLTVEGAEPVGDAEVRSSVRVYYDPVFGMEIGVLEDPVVIARKVRHTGSGRVTVTLEWQACNERTNVCLSPAEYEAVVDLGSAPAAAGSATISPSEASPAPSKAGGSLWSMILEAIAWGLLALLTPCVFPMVPMTVSFFMRQKKGKKLALVFGASIVLLYTVPIAVLIVISLLTGGQAVTADIFNWLATHWLPNILFFIIFMVFAASFLGAFEITLPSKLVNSSDKASDRGGVAGAFFVALTLVLVSFSCTGPIVGTVLIKSTQGEFWEPIVTMLAFSVAFALPFTVLAFAPSLLQKLPKSGGWLGTVKVVLGFIEIALGLKFLSVADQTYHWGILPRELYLAIWIVVFVLLGIYLFGGLRIGEEPAPVGGSAPSGGGSAPVGGGSARRRLSPLRIGLAAASFAFVVWLCTGLCGAPLKPLAGYLPPQRAIAPASTAPGLPGSAPAFAPSDLPGASGPAAAGSAAAGPGAPSVAGAPSASAASLAPAPPRKYTDFLHAPHGIPAYFDYAEALAAARAAGRPVLLDFTGHGCVNCREMEARVWSDPRVLSMLLNDYVVCSIYTDDKKTVAPEDWVTLQSGKVLKQLGKINSRFALERFGVNSQPCYMIIDPFTEQQKVPSTAYNLDVDAYLEFLQAGLK